MTKEKICGIYKIENTETGSVYIGSSIDIAQRWRKHKALLRHNKHTNIVLQQSWNKRGESSFKFSILENVLEDTLIIREQYWMDAQIESGFRLYNIRLQAESNRGYKHTEESKRKISEAGKGRKLSDDARAAASERMIGTTLSDESKRKLSVAIKELAADPNWQGRKNFDQTGKRQSPEQIAKRVAATAKTKAANKLLKGIDTLTG